MLIKESGLSGFYILEVNDKEKFDFLKPILGGFKIRNKKEFIFPKKAAHSIWKYFPGIKVKCSKDIQKEIKKIYDFKKKRKKNISLIKEQYEKGKILFEYDASKAKYEPTDHQKIMYNMIRYANCSGLFAEAGTMKTGSYLWAIDDYIKNEMVKRALIITLSGLKYNVLAEMKIQIPHRTGIVLDGKVHATKVFRKQFKKESMNRDYDIYIANYESMFSIEGLFDEKFFDLVLLDEAHRICYPSTRQAKTILNKFISTKYKYIVTGSLNDHDIMSHHTPIRFLGEDNVPIVHYPTAKADYMYEVAPNIWIEKPFKRKEVAQIVADIGVEYRKIDVIKSLQPILSIPKYAEMSPEQKRMTEELKKELVTTITDMCDNCSCKDNCNNSCLNTINGKNALVVVGKFQQIANGFVQRTIKRVGDDKKEETIYIDFKENPKLKLLDDIIEEIGNNKVIIWSNRIRSLETIYNHLQKKYKNKKGKDALRIWRNDNAFKTVERFKDSAFQFLVANPAKAGVGLNIQFSSFAITFDNSYSYREYTQKVSRQHRKGQKERVTVFQICLKDSIDLAVIKALQKRKNLSFDLGKLARITGTTEEMFSHKL